MIKSLSIIDIQKFSVLNYFIRLHYYLMETLHSILLKKTQRDMHQTKEDFSSRSKRKKRSESLETIFRLPKSVLDKFRHQAQSPQLKRQRSRNQRKEETIELGNIGQEYHHNLRKTILGQTKEILNSSKPHKNTFQQNNFMFSGEQFNHGKTLSQKEQFYPQYQKNLKTLKILQKAIIKEDQLFEVHQNLLELQANRFPIIRKRQSKRKKLLAAFEQRHHQFTTPRKEPPKQKQFRLEKRDFIPFPNTKKVKDEKIDIRGWDIPQTVEL